MMISVSIQSPIKSYYAGEASSISLPSIDGSFQILRSHAPIVARLAKGTITLRVQHKKKSISITEGILNFQNNQAIILVL